MLTGFGGEKLYEIKGVMMMIMIPIVLENEYNWLKAFNKQVVYISANRHYSLFVLQACNPPPPAPFPFLSPPLPSPRPSGGRERERKKERARASSLCVPVQ